MIRELIDLMLHRYIRVGDDILLYSGDEQKPNKTRIVAMVGWGSGAAMQPGTGGYIRRDIIRKDENGNWRYRYDN